MWLLSGASVASPSSVASEGSLVARDGAHAVAEDSMVVTECSTSLVILVTEGFVISFICLCHKTISLPVQHTFVQP